VIDISNPGFEKQMKAVEEILEELDLHFIPLLRIFNKVDLVQDQGYLQNVCKRSGAIGVSALNGENLTSLVEAMEKRLPLVPVGARSQANELPIS
jgi:GTP-binding protein HflX